MSKYTFLILIIFLFSSCEKKNDAINTDCNFTEEIKENYISDVRQLLYREIYRDSLQHPHFKTVHFNEKEIHKILNAIQAVKNLKSTESKLVFNHYNIHTFPRFNMRSISIKVDTSAPEIKNLLAGLPTGNYTLDSILQTFKFTEVDPAYSYPDFNWVNITSEMELNLFPILEALRNLAFIYYAESGGGMGDGNDIVLNRSGNSIILDFSIGRGDCPAGCIYREHWIFKVDENCNAIFLENLN